MVTAVTRDSDEVKFRVNIRTTMGRIKRSYADRISVPVRVLRFIFDGRPINGSDTLTRLQMEEDDMIKVY
ncbi:hypothetical protein KIN20_019406 [Parelaphostrongylus tenuis]|uniref:Ubiquitin-like domain-containing protein n=1 Tax=Parelaphostrongylus tenuis TaxID=148309 RepID=A0AAD5MKY9_PARTN|nr:hypothetical protein KIN20_019398 [Parelaphostrongylus tenuis]KAJ1360440.1 hypothetical protein KIN20_019406 [Parelaphostrongylus tenuis]